VGKKTHGNVARGVEYIQFGQTKQLYCRHEVILCAGIHNNEILQRSGVGPKSELQALGIPLIYDNANVGNGSKNHLISSALFSIDIADVPTSDPSALYTGGAFLPTPVNTPNPPGTVRGFQWIGVNASSGGNGLMAVVFYNLNPASIGTDRLQDRDPLRVSDVSENLFSNPADLADIVAVFRQQITALNTQLGIINPLYTLIQPSLATIANDDALNAYIQDNLDHAHHWTGTCKMAPLNQGGVVDAHGRVYGTKRLRVADISVAPLQPDGNTAAPAYLVGYKIANFILDEYKSK
jgi:choline dehydrogenase